VCARGFANASYLKRHQRAHTDEYPYVCPHADCARRFKHHSSLKVHHCESAEAVIAVHQCTIAGCERSFSSSSNLAQHMQRHLPCVTEYPCRHCGQPFTDRSNRNAHERRHLGAAAARPYYLCTQPGCGKHSCKPSTFVIISLPCMR